MDILSPNVENLIVEKVLGKMFPKSGTEIKLLMTAISTYDFSKDPFLTVNLIIDTITFIFTKDLPDIEVIKNVLISNWF